MAIQEYDFIIKYIKASNNGIADTLSRYASEFTEEHESDPSNVKILAMQYEIKPELRQRLASIHLEQDTDPNWCGLEALDNLCLLYTSRCV